MTHDTSDVDFIFCEPYSAKYLGKVCDKHINLNTAADAALRPFTAGIFRIK